MTRRLFGVVISDGKMRDWMRRRRSMINEQYLMKPNAVQQTAVEHADADSLLHFLFLGSISSRAVHGGAASGRLYPVT